MLGFSNCSNCGISPKVPLPARINNPKKETNPIKIDAHNNLIVNNLFILAYFVFKII